MNGDNKCMGMYMNMQIDKGFFFNFFTADLFLPSTPSTSFACYALFFHQSVV